MRPTLRQPPEFVEELLALLINPKPEQAKARQFMEFYLGYSTHRVDNALKLQ